jgi:hypothetical protein
MENYDFRPNNLLRNAVEKVCQQNPRLVLMPYEQMRAAALELARQIVAAADDAKVQV